MDLHKYKRAQCRFCIRNLQQPKFTVSLYGTTEGVSISNFSFRCKAFLTCLKKNCLNYVNGVMNKLLSTFVDIYSNCFKLGAIWLMTSYNLIK